MKRLISFFALLMVVFSSWAQSADEVIAADVNSAQWFALERDMAATPNDSLSPFMGLIGKAFVATKFNRPEASVEAFGELLQSHSQSLGLNNILMMSHLRANDLSKLGRNAEAAEFITGVLSATREYIDSVTYESFQDIAKQYEMFSKYQLNEVVMPENETPRVAFSLDSIHTEDSSSCYMRFINSTLNDKPIDFTFDTGAGINIINDSLAAVHGIKHLDVPVSAMGVDNQDGWLGLADEIKIGNILIKNVPFYVITISSGNEEADQYAKHLSSVLGIQIMQLLKEFTIDYVTNEITVATTPSSHSDAVPNMCYSNSLQLIGNFNNGAIQAIIDTGDAEYCSLFKSYYTKHKDEIKANGIPDTRRTAGAGGVRITEGYNLIDFPLVLDRDTVYLPEVYVTDQHVDECDGLVGIDALCLFKRLHFNMTDMTLTVE